MKQVQDAVSCELHDVTGDVVLVQLLQLGLALIVFSQITLSVHKQMSTVVSIEDPTSNIDYK